MENKEKCMACECPCEIHTVHNHPIASQPVGHNPKEIPGMVCRHCGHMHRADKECDKCGCCIK